MAQRLWYRLVRFLGILILFCFLKSYFSAVHLFNGEGCVKKQTADGADTQQMSGITQNKNSVSEIDAFDAQQTCSDLTVKGHTT